MFISPGIILEKRGRRTVFRWQTTEPPNEGGESSDGPWERLFFFPPFTRSS